MYSTLIENLFYNSIHGEEYLQDNEVTHFGMPGEWICCNFSGIVTRFCKNVNMCALPGINGVMLCLAETSEKFCLVIG